MGGQERIINDTVMRAVFRFKNTGARMKPQEFDSHTHWAALTPCRKFKAKSAANSLITETSIAIVHKFLCYNIFGKQEANKV
ncbi:hypothetical protein M9Y11_19470, partial [Clostridioides difficile]|nr:hypothetical protein [Clostridioides difficile]